MPQVQVTIGGRPYRLACNPGEEEQLAELGAFLDRRMEEMRAAFRDGEDPRIVIMAALSVADELFEARRKIETGAGETGQARRLAETQAGEAARARARVAELEAAIAETTARLEALGETLGARPRP